MKGAADPDHLASLQAQLRLAREELARLNAAPTDDEIGDVRRHLAHWAGNLDPEPVPRKLPRLDRGLRR